MISFAIYSLKQLLLGSMAMQVLSLLPNLEEGDCGFNLSNAMPVVDLLDSDGALA